MRMTSILIFSKHRGGGINIRLRYVFNHKCLEGDVKLLGLKLLLFVITVLKMDLFSLSLCMSSPFQWIFINFHMDNTPADFMPDSNCTIISSFAATVEQGKTVSSPLCGLTQDSENKISMRNESDSCGLRRALPC